MRIITVNLPEAYIKAIAQLCGNLGLYPSRSELIRVAVREFLIREMSTARDFEEYQKKKEESIPVYDKKKFVNVPIEEKSNGEVVYKQFNLIRGIEK